MATAGADRPGGSFMIRKLQLLAMVLFLSAQMAASAQAAAPTRTVAPKITAEVGLFAEALKLLSTWLRGQPLSPPSSLSIPNISSQLDPNGQH
jgi:hypothetical protein